MDPPSKRLVTNCCLVVSCRTSNPNLLVMFVNAKTKRSRELEIIDNEPYPVWQTISF